MRRGRRGKGGWPGTPSQGALSMAASTQRAEPGNRTVKPTAMARARALAQGFKGRAPESELEGRAGRAAEHPSAVADSPIITMHQPTQHQKPKGRGCPRRRRPARCSTTAEQPPEAADCITAMMVVATDQLRKPARASSSRHHEARAMQKARVKTKQGPPKPRQMGMITSSNNRNGLVDHFCIEWRCCRS